VSDEKKRAGPKRKRKKKKREDDEPISLYPMTLEEALKKAMEAPWPPPVSDPQQKE
jgi:hypothetical protein